jgi:hypothetical protein
MLGHGYTQTTVQVGGGVVNPSKRRFLTVLLHTVEIRASLHFVTITQYKAHTLQFPGINTVIFQNSKHRYEMETFTPWCTALLEKLSVPRLISPKVQC